MTQFEEELLQVIRRWNEDAENILRSATDDPAEDYSKGFSHGLRQAAQELRNFMWDRFCREANAGAMVGMMYRDGGQ